MTIVPLYLSEISPIKRRGAIGGIHFLMFAIGLLLSQVSYLLDISYMPEL